MSDKLVRNDHFHTPTSLLLRKNAGQAAVYAIYSLAKGLECLGKSNMTVAEVMFRIAGKSGALAVAFKLIERQIKINDWKEYCGAKA